MFRGPKKKRERKTIKQTLNYREQTEGYWRGDTVGWVLRRTHDEHWVLYVRDESLNSTPKTNITLYVC